MTDPLDGVAIIGFAGRFPGADSADAFWQNVKAGVESITTFPDDVLAAAGHDVRALRAEPGFVPARGIIDRAEWFDASFFGMSPLEAEVTDPQQRLLLELAWEALEHAGYDPRACPGAVGVYAGVGANTYYLNWLLKRPDLLEAVGAMQELIGRDKDFVATRIAFKLDLKGPALSIHTACSTSLVTTVQAAQAVLGYQCDMALAGGASIVFPQATGYVFEEGGILSPDGHTRAFDAAAQGTVFSSGAGLVVLKRLADAVADRDRVYAVIKGAALNNDGFHKASFTAPSARAHTAVIALAQALAGVEPRSIGYVEAHGTATPIGDPIEVAGLAEAFGAGAAPRSCALGSVKTNVGHLDIAAGVAGLIKTALAVDEGLVPPTLHYSTPNPRIDFAHTPFFVPTTLEPWPGPRPRRAGVSSFGVGGTNAHVILEEPPPQLPRSGADAPSTLLVLSARTPVALDAATARLADALATDPSLSMRDVAHTLRTGRHPFERRRALVCSQPAQAARILRGGDARELATGPQTTAAPSPVFMFPGGGAQHVAMGQGLLRYAPVFREELERCLRLVGPSRDLAPVLWAAAELQDEAAARFEAPSWGLPALFAHEFALARQWMAWGVTPSALIGHSMGEYTAACIAGVMSVEDAIGIVLLRGQLFETLAAGGMLAVPLSEQGVRGQLPSALAVAAVNAAGSCVVSGEPAALAGFAEALAADGVECRRLRISVAAHSPMVEPILDAFRRHLESVRLAAPAIPVISNVTGTWLSDHDAQSPDYWVRHLRQTVRFSQGVATLCDTPGRVLIEVGPGQALSTFARQHVAPAPPLVLTSSRRANDLVDDLAVLLQAVGRAWVAGLPIDWTGLPDTHDARRVPLPTYPFERRRFAPDLAAAVRHAAPAPRDQSATTVSSAPVRGLEPTLSDASSVDGDVIERVVHEQLRVMAEQLRVLGGTPPSDSDDAGLALPTQVDDTRTGA